MEKFKAWIELWFGTFEYYAKFFAVPLAVTFIFIVVMVIVQGLMYVP